MMDKFPKQVQDYFQQKLQPYRPSLPPHQKHSSILTKDSTIDNNFQSYPQNYPSMNSNIMQSPYPTYSRPYSNATFNQQTIYGKKSYMFDFEMENAFISKEKQWLNSLKNPQANIMHSEIGKTVTKPNSSSLADQKRNQIDLHYDFEQNLAKTVKHSTVPYKKIQPEINPQQFKASSIYGQPQRISQQASHFKDKGPKLTSSHNQSSQKHSIMSIDQIREVEKKEFSQKTIHKITSSASRNKLKSSSSKDSKGSSVNLDNQSTKLNGQTERYNKYINSELINLNIDLKRETPNNIIAPNLNVRRFGGSEPLYSQHQPFRVQNHLAKSRPINQTSRIVSTAQDNYTPLVQNLTLQPTKQEQNEQLVYRESIPRQDKGLPLRVKTRSKSNLSRYSQLKDQHNNMNRQCLINCDKKMAPSSSKETEIVMHQNLEKSIKNQKISEKKSQKRIHFVSYSSIDKNQEKSSKINSNFSANYQTELSGNITSRESKREQIQKVAVSFSGMKSSQQARKQRPQTQRKSITNFNLHPQILQGEKGSLNQLIEEKMRKRPIRLTIQKKN